MISSDYRRGEATVVDINVALSEWQMKVINQRVQPVQEHSSINKRQETHKGRRGVERGRLRMCGTLWVMIMAACRWCKHCQSCGRIKGASNFV